MFKTGQRVVLPDGSKGLYECAGPVKGQCSVLIDTPQGRKRSYCVESFIKAEEAKNGPATKA